MRQWMVDTNILCRKHLLGEHVEHHMFHGTIKKRKCLKGYIKNNLLEIASLKKRHDCLSEEMKKRGYNHNTEFVETLDLSYIPEDYLSISINKDDSLKDLLSRCEECRRRFDLLK
jgi:hypothetical protein